MGGTFSKQDPPIQIMRLGIYVIIAYAILRLFLLFKNRNVDVLKKKHSPAVKMNEEPEKKRSKRTIPIKTFKKLAIQRRLLRRSIRCVTRLQSL